MPDHEPRELALGDALAAWFADPECSALFKWWNWLSADQQTRLIVRSAFVNRVAGPGLSISRAGIMRKAVIQPDGTTLIDCYAYSQAMDRRPAIAQADLDRYAAYRLASDARLARLNAALAEGTHEMVFYVGAIEPERISAELWREGGLRVLPERVVVNRAGQRVMRGAGLYIRIADVPGRLQSPKNENVPTAKIVSWFVQTSQVEKAAKAGQREKEAWVDEAVAKYRCSENKAVEAYRAAAKVGAWFRRGNGKLIPPGV